MYYQAIAQLARNLQAINGWLDKAEQAAAVKKFSVDVLLNDRLAPDMGPLIYQVQSACDYVKGGAAWLSGQRPPRHIDDERTIDDLRERIRKTIAFVECVREEQYTSASTQRISLSWAPAGRVLAGEDALLRAIIPNAYFHIAMAYAILRRNGVDVGKMDFLGPLNWAEA
jgi:hypothetical protein